MLNFSSVSLYDNEVGGVDSLLLLEVLMEREVESTGPLEDSTPLFNESWGGGSSFRVSFDGSVSIVSLKGRTVPIGLNFGVANPSDSVGEKCPVGGREM